MRPILTGLVAAAPFLGAIGAAPAVSQAAGPQPVVVIGDSLNDTGTFAGVTRTGRFTNTPGLLWTEIVADALGGTAAPVQVYDGSGFEPRDGTNWAQSGALVTEAGGLYDGVSLSVRDQLTGALAEQIAPGTVVLMDGGGPDVLRAVAMVGEGATTPEAAAKAVAEAGRALADEAARVEAAGARVVLVNAGNFGNFPLLGAGEGPGAPLGTALSAAFNDAVAARAGEIGLEALQIDAFAFFDRVIADPGAFGLDNVTDPSCDLARTEPTPTRAAANCTEAELIAPDAARTHLFADDVHGSAAAHELLAQHALDVMAAAGLDLAKTD